MSRSDAERCHRLVTRRAVLRGLGASVALPLFESFRPAGMALASFTGHAPPTRMAFLYIPNGVNVEQWRSTGQDREFRFGPSLEPIAAFKDHVQVIAGLAHQSGTAGRDGAGDHARASATFLTGARPKKTAGGDVRVGVSVDQVAASVIGEHTRLPSLELSCDGKRTSGNCDSGYSCAYQYNIAWRTATCPVAPETNPRLVFERLFGEGPASERAANMAARRAAQKSILDFVKDDAKAMERRLAGDDRLKLDEYLDAVRAMERQLTRFDSPPAYDRAAAGAPEPQLPDGPPAAYAAHLRLLADMMVLAFQTDSTRIGTFMFAHDGSNRSFPDVGVSEGHHELSHHQNSPERLDKIARIDRFHAEQLAYILERMHGIKEVDGQSLLDHAMVVYASGLSDGNRHRHDDLPVVLAGRAGGRLAAGRHVQLPGEQPMTNLYMTMLDLLGATQKSFGDSTGSLDAVLA